jgi:hypothetical protein
MQALGDFIDMAAAISKTNRNVRLPDPLHNDVKSAAAKLGITLEKAYEMALVDWLANLRGDPPPKQGRGKPPIVFPSGNAAESKNLSATFSVPDNRKLLEMLAIVLKHGAADEIRLVKEGIELFANRIREDPPEGENPRTEGRKRPGR